LNREKSPKNLRNLGESKLLLEYSEQVSLAVCQELKHIREKKGMTHLAVAQKAGLSRATIQHIEKGIRNPTLMVAYAVSEALGVPLIDVIKKVERDWKKK
jgi:putative transcriptional regulator